MNRLFYILLLAIATSCASNEQARYSWEEDLHHRLLCDFTKSKDEVKAYIQKYIPNVSDQQMDEWEKRNALECKIIDNKKLYFQNAASNLFRIDRACAQIKAEKDGVGSSGSEEVDKTNVPQIIRLTEQGDNTPQNLALPKRMRVTYTLTVNADAVPAGEKLRCWLPFPRKDINRQTDVRLLSTSEKTFQYSNPKCKHSTVYMEKTAEAGKPTVFSESFEYTSYGAFYDLENREIKPYDTKSELYKTYTAEREKHIRFTPRLRQLADSLTAGITEPLKKAQKIFRWINATFPWASAREYSTIDNIPEYVLENRHGDCGQVSLLFITLCRICGIPAHFQSGFMMHPGAWNLHDWAEIYFEGIGWVPVDQSFGIPSYAANEKEEMFFLGGIDSWRMVVNNDYGMELSPKKKYPRSETVDFQRGEVEWQGGNLYFDQWDYRMKIEYLDK